MQQASPDTQTPAVLGFKPKTWAILITITVAIIFVAFILIPFIIAMVAPLIQGETSHLVSLMDGTALIVGVFGTVASIASICMTIADKKRYNQEKEQMQELVDSVAKLHTDIDTVSDYVIKTFDQNARLAFALYENKVIGNNPNMVDISTNSPKHSNPSWQDCTAAGELPPSQ